MTKGTDGGRDQAEFGVLVVDDDEAVREVTAGFLSEAGCRRWMICWAAGWSGGRAP